MWGVCDSEGNDQQPEEVSIWLGIINGYVNDAVRGDKKAQDFLFQHEHEDEFEEICDMANVDMGWIRRKVRDRIIREWRKKQEKASRGNIKTGDDDGKS